MNGIDPNRGYNQVLQSRGGGSFLDSLGGMLQQAHQGMEQLLMGGLQFAGALAGMLFGVLGSCGAACGGI